LKNFPNAQTQSCAHMKTQAIRFLPTHFKLEILKMNKLQPNFVLKKVPLSALIPCICAEIRG
jgi:hypothetical protein